MASVSPQETVHESGEHEHLKRSLQQKFAQANEEPAAQGELWQSRVSPKVGLPVVILPAPTDITILRRYAEEAQKQNLREHIAQVYHSARVLFYGADVFLHAFPNSRAAIIGLALSALIVAIGLPAKWALNILDSVGPRQQALIASLKERVTGERARALLAYVEAWSLYLLEVAERITGRKGLADSARRTATQTKEQLVTRVANLETEVQKKKEQLLTSIASGKQELRDREASITGVVRRQKDEIIRTVQHGGKEVIAVMSPLRSGLQVKRRINEFVVVANILVQTALAVSLILILLPRNLLSAAVGRKALVAGATTVPVTLKKTE